MSALQHVAVLTQSNIAVTVTFVLPTAFAKPTDWLQRGKVLGGQATLKLPSCGRKVAMRVLVGAG